MPPFWATSAGEPNETFPGATAYTGVPPGAATSTPKWTVRPPAAMRGSHKNPRTGCWWSNGLTGHGYGGEAVVGTPVAIKEKTSDRKGEAVDVSVVGRESVAEHAPGRLHGAEVGVVVLEQHLALLDSGWKPGEAHRAVRARAAPDGDQVEEA